MENNRTVSGGVIIEEAFTKLREEAVHVSSEAEAKEQRLRALLLGMESVVVAFSGGVDSSYVAYLATEVLGKRALCVTGESASLAAYQRVETENLVKRFRLQHEIIHTRELN